MINHQLKNKSAIKHVEFKYEFIVITSIVIQNINKIVFVYEFRIVREITIDLRRERE
jgi:hypothetical protein